MLNEPLQVTGGGKTTVPEPTPAQLEAEGEDFMAALHALGGR